MRGGTTCLVGVGIAPPEPTPRRVTAHDRRKQAPKNAPGQGQGFPGEAYSGKLRCLNRAYRCFWIFWRTRKAGLVTIAHTGNARSHS